MAEEHQVTLGNASDIFRQVIRQKTGLGVVDATPAFKTAISEIIANFSYSPTIGVFAPFSAGYGFVRQQIFYRSPVVNPAVVFGVMPLYDEVRDEFAYAIVADEAGLWPRLCELSGKKPTEADLKMTTYQQVLDGYVAKHGPTQGPTKLSEALRYILMHEIMHITLAHQHRDERLAERFGIQYTPTESSSEKEQHLAAYLHQASNHINDSFINEGLDQLKKDVEPLLEKLMKRVVDETENRTTSVQEIRNDFAHLYNFSKAQIIGSCDAASLAKFLKEELKGESDLEEKAKDLIKTIEKGEMLKDLFEEDVAALIWAAAIRRTEKNVCPSCKKPMDQHDQPSAGSNGTQPQPGGAGSQSSQQQTGDGGQQTGSQSGQSAGSTQSSGAQPGSQSGKPAKSSQSGGGQDTCSCQIGKSQTFQVTVKTADGSLDLNITVDANGNIIAVSPTKADANSNQKLEDLSVEVGRQISEIERAAAENMDDEDRQKTRGFGSIWGRSLSKVVEQFFPWQTIVENFIGKYPSEVKRQSWLKPVRGLQRKGWAYPDDDTFSNPGGYSILLFIDASGSMSDREVEKAVGAVLSASIGGIKQVYIIAHDSDVADLSKVPKLAQLAKSCKADKKVLQQYGVLKLQLSDARMHKRKIHQILTEFAKYLPSGGTSHVVPVQTLAGKGFFQKELSRSKLSGAVMYTDCCSDLEALPSVLNDACKKHNFKTGVPVTIIDSTKTSSYSHPIWPVVSVGGHVSVKKAKKAKAAV